MPATWGTGRRQECPPVAPGGHLGNVGDILHEGDHPRSRLRPGADEHPSAWAPGDRGDELLHDLTRDALLVPAGRMEPVTPADVTWGMRTHPRAAGGGGLPREAVRHDRLRLRRRPTRTHPCSPGGTVVGTSPPFCGDHRRPHSRSAPRSAGCRSCSGAATPTPPPSLRASHRTAKGGDGKRNAMPSRKLRMPCGIRISHRTVISFSPTLPQWRPPTTSAVSCTISAMPNSTSTSPGKWMRRSPPWTGLSVVSSPGVPARRSG